MTSMRIPAGLYFHGAEAVPESLASLADAPDDAPAINVRRIRRYRGGLSRFTGLRELWAQAVDQDFLDDIANAPTLERVYLSQLTATDLSPLARLPRMVRLRINGATRMTDLDWAAPLRSLDVLALEHLPKVRSLAPLGSIVATTRSGTLANGVLKVLAIDRATFTRVFGSMENIMQRNMEQYLKYTTQAI